jgi:subtilisin family serine protease
MTSSVDHRQPLAALLVAILLVVGVPAVAAGPVGASPAPPTATPDPLPPAPSGASAAAADGGSDVVRLLVEPAPTSGPGGVARAARSAAVPASTRSLYGSRRVVVEVPAADVEATMAGLAASPEVAGVELDGVARTAMRPDDELWSRSEHEGFRISRFPEAWDRTTGSPDVVIAILDTGVTPTSEIQGRVLPGRSFITGSISTLDDHVVDGYSHGTMAATVAAARGNNGEGLAGACWRCSILPVKVLGPNGAGPLSAVAEGIRWAADNGADVISMSLTTSTDHSEVRDAVRYARDQGVLLVAASGNQGLETPIQYPAAYAEVVGVGGITNDGCLSQHGNFGSWVSLAASFVNPAQAFDGDYYAFAGTSSATPVVAGAAALALSAQPSLTVADLERRLVQTAMPVHGVRHGIVDAARLVGGPTPPVAVVTYPGSLFGVEQVGVLVSDATETTPAPALRLCTGPSATTVAGLTQVTGWAWATEWDTRSIPHGTRTLVASVRGPDGDRRTATRLVRVLNTPPPSDFADVPRDAFYTVPVDFLAHTGVTTGSGGNLYRPAELVTRAQMAVFLWRMAGQPAASGAGFDDVPADAFSSTATRWLRDAGITTGVGDNRFDPTGNVTRAQMVNFLHRFAGLPEGAPSHPFTDLDPVAHAYAQAAVSWAAHHGISGGLDATRFGPAGSVTRAQMAAFLQRYARTRAAHGPAAVPLGV